MSAPLLEITDIDLTRGGRALVGGLTLRILPGESWAVLGENGSGKTTLLLTLAGLLPSHPPVRLDGTALAELPRRAVARRLGLLPQEQNFHFPSSVHETVLSGRHPHLRRFGGEGPADLAITDQALEATELGALAHRQSDTLSGGERQRLAIATLLAQDPAVLLLDEPVNHLDLRHRLQVLRHLEDLRERGRAVVMSLHEPELARRFSTHALLLFGDGHWLAGPHNEVMTGENLSRLYGVEVTVGESGIGYG